MRRVLVIGGGPAGMMAAYEAARMGAKVALFEKNDCLGKKLAITGKGRCNVTNACDVEDLLKNVPQNPSFLYSAFYTFPNDRVMAFFEDLGVPLKVERGGRVFPVSDRAADVVGAMRRALEEAKVKTVHAAVKRVLLKDGRVVGVLAADGKKYAADAVIVATGGLSYPQTGSTGDGYRFAKDAGHTVTELRPSLVPLVTKEHFDLTGLSLKNTAIRAYRDKKCVYEDFGEMLFTHYGVSGPMILSASSHLREEGEVRLSIDLKPALSPKELDKRILRDFEKVSRRHFSHALDDLLPKKMIPVMIKRSGIHPEKETNSVTREERARLVSLFKDFTLTVTGRRPIAEAIITSGGVHVKEIDPGTMESKLCKGLYFAGEVIDCDAYTGGFNLQIAFSTGYLAGKDAGGDKK